MQTLFGTKLGMTSVYDSRGRRVGATMLKVEPNLVTQVKSVEVKDGYNAVQLGYAEKKSVRKPQLGHLKKAGIEKKVRWLREVRADEDIKPGTEIALNQVFSVGDSVKITGVSKGRGFAGGVKRHGFHGGPKTHGQSDRHRAPGSIGAGTTPGRVYKGKKMAGHMGAENVSYRGLEVVGLDKTENILTIKGGVPGPIGGLIRIENIGKIKGYTPPPEEKNDEEEESPVEKNGVENPPVEDSTPATEANGGGEAVESEVTENTESAPAEETPASEEAPVSEEGDQDANS